MMTNYNRCFFQCFYSGAFITGDIQAFLWKFSIKYSDLCLFFPNPAWLFERPEHSDGNVGQDD